MLYCVRCGSELKGAKKFCNVCGTKQPARHPGPRGRQEPKLAPIPEKPKPVKKEEEVVLGECIRCGQEAERKCFFCDGYICKDHVRRMQANCASRIDMEHYIKYEDRLRINQGWRGFIIYACVRCSSIKHMKDLTPDETDKIRTVDVCTWYSID